MCETARKITKIVTREECQEYEEVYGVHVFDTAFFMWNVPSCRYALANLIKQLGIDERFVRRNEISLRSTISRAMVYHFGEPEIGGWGPQHCDIMWDAIHNHLVSGLSRDYNTPLGLGHLYRLVSKKPLRLPSQMMRIMLESSKVSDTHPTVIEFIHRWNRLCAKYEGQDEPSPIFTSKSIMLPLVNVNWTPRLEQLPFEFVMADFFENKAAQHVPKLFKKQITKLMANDERRHQGLKRRESVTIEYNDVLLRLKLFIQEAVSIGALPLVDDFVLRRHYYTLFAEGGDWVAEMNQERPKKDTRLMLKPLI